MPIETRTVQPVAEYEGGAAGRLARARRQAWERVATIAANHGANAATVVRNMAADDWRTAARGRFDATTARQAGAWQALDDLKPRASDADRAYYVDSFDVLGWRDLGTAEEVSKREGSRSVEHSGWYCDAAQMETVSGHVLQLPSRDGSPRYVSAVSWSDRDGVTVWPLRIYAEPLKAARAADQEAERIGESEREYSKALGAGAEYQELCDDIGTIRRETLAVLKEWRAARADAANAGRTRLCAVIREKVESALESIADLRRKREALADGEDSRFGFWTGDPVLRAAFNEGAGAQILT